MIIIHKIKEVMCRYSSANRRLYWESILSAGYAGGKD
jgi:hypothetical protein